MAKKSLKEALGGHTSSHVVGPTLGGDAGTGHGYGRLKAKWHVPHMSGNDFPYDTYETEDPEDWWDEGGFQGAEEKKEFANKAGLHHLATDPHKKRDLRTMFDDQNTNMAGPVTPESTIRKYIKLIIEDAFRLRSRSSEPDYVTNQFGQKINGGTQFGWSSAFPFDTPESREPAYSLKDIMKKTEVEPFDYENDNEDKSIKDF